MQVVGSPSISLPLLFILTQINPYLKIHTVEENIFGAPKIWNSFNAIK